MGLLEWSFLKLFDNSFEKNFMFNGMRKFWVFGSLFWNKFVKLICKNCCDEFGNKLLNLDINFLLFFENILSILLFWMYKGIFFKFLGCLYVFILK